MWELQLLSRLPEEASIASLPLPNDDDRQRHQGWIRYIIHVPSSDDDVAFNAPNYRGLVERCLIRLGLRDGRELKPQPWPGSIDDAEQSIEGLTEADRAADRALQRLESLYVVLKNAYGPERYASARALVEHAASDVLRCLANVRDVRLGDRPIRVGTAAVKPEIHVGGDTEGASAVELSWKPTIEQLVDVGHGFVLDGSGMLRPLDRHIPARMKPLMVEPLPSVPVDDVERFVEAFVVKSPVPVRLRRSSAWGARQRGQFERQVLLSEQEDVLLLTPRFGYQAHEGSSSNVDVDDPSTLVVLYSDDGRPVLMERDDEAEDDACAALAFAILGVDNANEVRWPVRLRGVEAYDFLEEVLPGLREQGWVIFGVSSLRAHQIHRMNVEVSVASDVDWFDVGVGFEAAEEVVPTADVLESWALGRRYHRLRDGSVARLPERWLERHGHTLSELRDVQRAAGRRLGAWAAPMAKELLEAAEPSEGQKTWRRLAELLETFETIPDVEPCVPVQATLRDYQKIGVRWLSFLRDTGLGGILADDMGLGKTLQVLVTLADTHGLDRGMMSLVVAPVSVLRNWAAEAKRFVPGLNVHVHHGHNRRDTVPPDTEQ
ncbi:MAG: DEAD/DEAH box helicase, partial [Myxococcota bacterium]